MKFVEVAESIARVAHEGQVRKLGEEKGKPYIVHPERIAAKVEGDTLKSIAWLHDVLEDCPAYTSLTLAVAGIPEDVIDVVKLLTRRPGVPYLEYLLGVVTNDYAIEVKLMDLEDNLRTCPPGNMRDKYELAKYILENY